MPYQRLEITRPHGTNIDLSPYELPNEVWSESLNVNFRNFRTNREIGYNQVFPDLDIQPLFAIPWTDYSTNYWVYADEDAIYRSEGTAQLDITRETASVKVPYTGGINDRWTGIVFNGALVLNNGVDAPQYFDVASANMDDLTAWPSSYKAGVVRSFKNYLVALDITDNLGERYPLLVKWSDAADAGAVPASWDETDPTTQAGETVLPDTEGRCIDGRALNDSFIIYKTDSVWAMQFIGGNFIFSFRKIFSDTGILAKDCVAEFDGKHFVVGVGDVFVHDGSSKKSIITNRVKNKLYSTVNGTYIENVRCVADHANKEIWVYFPDQDSSTGLASKALIWNWEVDAWSEKEISEIAYIAEGDMDPQESDAWDDDSATWDTDTTAWGEENYNPSNKELIMCDYTNSKFYQANSTTTQDGATYTSSFERTGLDFGDDLNVKYVNSITPHFSGEGSVDIFVGTESRQGEGVQWSAPFNFSIGDDYKADFRQSGRYIGVKFVSDSIDVWALTGYTIEYESAGER